MAVAPTSSGHVIEVGASAASGSTSITVPADADFTTIEVAGFRSQASPTNISAATLSIGGKASTYIGAEIDGTSDGDQSGAHYVKAPPTGTQTFSWAWGSGAWSDGGGVVIKFWKGVDQTTPIGTVAVNYKAGVSSPGTVTLPALTVAAGDYVSVVGYFYNVGGTRSWSGVTEDYFGVVSGTSGSDIGSASSAQASAGTVTPGVTYTQASSSQYIVLTGYVIKAVASSPQTLHLGTIASAASAKGINLTAGAATLAVGTIASTATAHGIDLLASPLQLGTITSTAVANGINLTAGPATLALGHVANTPTVNGIDVVQSGTFGTLVTVGRGIMDSQRSIVRDANNRVWIFASEDRPFQGDTSEETVNFLRAYRADQTGIPSTFTEVDTAHRPLSDSATDTLCVPDVRLDSTGVVHLIWTDWSQRLWYTTFNTNTGLWGGTITQLASGLNLPAATSWKRSHYAGALAIDGSDTLHVIYTAGTTVSYISKTSGGAWSAAATIATGQISPDHPNIISDSGGNLYAVWINDQANTTSSINYQQKVSGSWLAGAETLTTGALNNTDLDQTPGIALLNGTTPIALYLDSSQNMQTRTRTGANTWSAADGPGIDTHAPGLYVQGGDIWLGEGHSIGTTPDIQSAYAYKLSGQAWSAEQILTQNTDYKDGSASMRYESHRRDPWPQYIDVAYMDEDIDRNATDGSPQHYAEVYYAAIQPAQIALGTVTNTPTVHGLNLSAGSSTISGAAALTGAGSLSASGVRTTFDTTALTGLGSSTAGGIRTTFASSALSGLGSLAATATHTAIASAALSGLGSLASAGIRKTFGGASLSGAGSSIVAGIRKTFATAALTGAGSLSATFVHRVLGAVGLTGSGSLSASGIRTAIASANLTGLGGSTVGGIRKTLGAASLSGIGSLSALGGLLWRGVANLVGSGTASASGTVSRVLGDDAATVVGQAVISGHDHFSHERVLVNGVWVLKSDAGDPTTTGDGQPSGVWRL